VDNLNVKVTVNGQAWGNGNTKGMQHSIAEMVAYASLGELLRPGELLATGTIPGCSGVEIGRWLSPGDEIELWIERVGTLKNIVGSPEV
jgi:2-keto-4-pentenoate hydratase/2-oxohepta-3-ene-1,7-dioic acid hydratase in catechol pathway